MNITKENALKIKGFAIILMIIHHSFGFPEYWIEQVQYPSFEILGQTSFYWLSTITKVCVGIFAFLTGYAYFYNQNPTFKNSLKRIAKLLKRYWLILFGILVPLFYLCNSGQTLTIKQIFLSMFGLQEGIELFGWYVYFYIGIMLVLPMITKYFITNSKMWNFVFFPFICIIMKIVCVAMIEYINSKIIFNAIWTLLGYFPCVIYGYLIAKYNLIEKIQKWCRIKKIWQAILVTIIVLLLRAYKPSIWILNLDFLYVPIIVSALAFIFHKIGKTGKVFTFLGKHSTNLWFLHSVFFAPLLREKTQALAYLPHNPILIVIWIILLCLPLSILVNKIIEWQERVSKNKIKVA